MLGKGCLVWGLVVGGMSCACAQPLGASPSSLKGVLVQHLRGRWRGTVCHCSRAGLAPRHGSSICSCRKPSCSASTASQRYLVTLARSWLHAKPCAL